MKWLFQCHRIVFGTAAICNFWFASKNWKMSIYQKVTTKIKCPLTSNHTNWRKKYVEFGNSFIKKRKTQQKYSCDFKKKKKKDVPKLVAHFVTSLLSYVLLYMTKVFFCQNQIILVVQDIWEIFQSNLFKFKRNFIENLIYCAVLWC